MVTSLVASHSAFGVKVRNRARRELRCWTASAHASAQCVIDPLPDFFTAEPQRSQRSEEIRRDQKRFGGLLCAAFTSKKVRVATRALTQKNSAWLAM